MVLGGVDGSEVGGGGGAVVGNNSTLRFFALAVALALPLTISGTVFDQDGTGTRGTSELHRRHFQSQPVERPQLNPL